MKKVTTLMILIAVIVTACNSSSEKQSDDGKVESGETTNSKQAQEKPFSMSKEDIAQGKILIGESDCLTCHSEQQKLVGPAYIDVAKKYEATSANVDYLSDKILKGGSGVWGEIPMAPHPGLRKEDTKKMAKYILSLRE